MILTTIGGGFQLEQGAALSRLRSLAAGCPWGITAAYRTSARQAELYQGYLANLPGYNFALPPGTSKHELGLAVDVKPSTATWLVTHGAEYGWRRTNPSEWWHFEYFINEDTHANEGDDMQPVEVWAYKNGTGAPDAFQIVNNAAAYAAQANAKADRILAALAKIPAASTTAPVIDYAKLAKAVNDDAARRMQA